MSPNCLQKRESYMFVEVPTITHEKLHTFFITTMTFYYSFQSTEDAAHLEKFSLKSILISHHSPNKTNVAHMV